MESVTWLRWRLATPPVLTPQDCPGVPTANFRITLGGLSCPVVGLPSADRSVAGFRVSTI